MSELIKSIIRWIIVILLIVLIIVILAKLADKDSKTKQKVEAKDTSNYLVFNENIKVNKKINLYQNNKKRITLNKINVPIQYQDENNYYISFINNIYQVPNKQKINIKKTENIKEKGASKIQVLNYKTINDTCSGYECINTNIVKEQISKLKENGYYFITKEEYEKFLKDYIHLKEKAKKSK